MALNDMYNGFPKGSLLGPTPLKFINELANTVKMHFQADDLDVTKMSKLNPSKQCVSASNKAKGKHFGTRSSISCRKPDVFGPRMQLSKDLT